jgi:hypothetical protein
MTAKWDLLLIATVMATLIVVALAALGWIAGLITRSLKSLYVSRYQVAQAFPVQVIDEGEGTYRIEGVMRGTEEEVIWTIDARTRANAIAKAELRGAVVTQVQKVQLDHATSGAVEIAQPSDPHPVTTV